MKLELEQQIKAIDVQIKDARHHAAVAATLEHKLEQQKAQHALETRRSKLRRELFNWQDEIEARRNELIAQLEEQLQQTVDAERVFLVEWELRVQVLSRAWRGAGIYGQRLQIVTTLSEDLAAKILAVLTERKLLLPEDAQKFVTSLPLGKVGPDDWRLAIEKAMDKAIEK